MTKFYLKRFLTFRDEPFYPQGGMDGFLADFDDLQEAKQSFVESNIKGEFIYSIYDCELRNEVYCVRMDFGAITNRKLKQ